MNKNISISIIIPVFNSQSTIYLLIKKIIAELDKNLEFEIILINDNSADLSELECIRAYNDYSGTVKFYSLGKNVGEHRAVMAGLNHASGDWAIIMDDDFQNPISELKLLINHSLNNDFDVVYEVLDEDTGNFDYTTVTFNYRKWDACMQYDPNTGSSYQVCIGNTATLHFNTPDPAFPTPNN